MLDIVRKKYYAVFAQILVGIQDTVTLAQLNLFLSFMIANRKGKMSRMQKLLAISGMD